MILLRLRQIWKFSHVASWWAEEWGVESLFFNLQLVELKWCVLQQSLGILNLIPNMHNKVLRALISIHYILIAPRLQLQLA